MNKEIKLHHVDFYNLPNEEVVVNWEMGVGYVVYIDIMNSDKKLKIVLPESLNKAIQRQVYLASLGD